MRFSSLVGAAAGRRLGGVQHARRNSDGRMLCTDTVRASCIAWPPQARMRAGQRPQLRERQHGEGRARVSHTSAFAVSTAGRDSGRENLELSGDVGGVWTVARSRVTFHPL